jgi:hypothetical protein
MTLRRAVFYIGGASLLAAWFASAASVSLNRNPRQIARETDQTPSPIEDLALQVQQQAKRLRERLAAAPLPQEPARNPFSFRTLPPRPQPRAVRRVEAPAPIVPAEPPEPILMLVGVAEQNRPAGVVRTAMLETGGDQMILATVGEPVLHRYKITAISVDAVELTDLSTGRVRRLALQFQ